MPKPKQPTRTYPMMLPEEDDVVHNRNKHEARATVVQYSNNRGFSSAELNDLLAMLGLMDA